MNHSVLVCHFGRLTDNVGKTGGELRVTTSEMYLSNIGRPPTDVVETCAWNIYIFIHLPTNAAGLSTCNHPHSFSMIPFPSYNHCTFPTVLSRLPLHPACHKVLKLSTNESSIHPAHLLHLWCNYRPRRVSNKFVGVDGGF